MHPAINDHTVVIYAFLFHERTSRKIELRSQFLTSCAHIPYSPALQDKDREANLN